MRVPKDLESAAAFHARAVADVKSYEELRNAPVVDAEDFHGPVLFSGDAASDVLNKLFVPNVESDRPDLGTTARTTGAYQSSLRARVLPDLMNVEDDPLEAMFRGQERWWARTRWMTKACRPRRWTWSRMASWWSYLTGRTPIRDFPSFGRAWARGSRAGGACACRRHDLFGREPGVCGRNACEAGGDG